MEKYFFNAIGQDSHRFDSEQSRKPLIVGGVVIPDIVGLEGNSDADVLLHALCNALSGLSCVNILGAYTDKLCMEEKITDSRVYLRKALSTLGDNIHLVHLSITIEAQRPRLSAYIDSIRKSIADLVNLNTENIGITATSGEGLSAYGRGEGIQVFIIASAYRLV